MRTLPVILIALAACTTSGKLTPATGGDPAAGKRAIEAYGCQACHSIPDIRGCGGQVGPPLDHIATRAYIGGELPNTPSNLVQWLYDPGGVEKHTAMPTLGLTKKEARDVAAYLYTLD
jgi:cytochrome c2